MADGSPSGRADRARWSVTVLAFVSAAYFLPGATWSPVSRFCLTRAIVERRSLEITPFAASTGDRAEVSGRFYTDKAPVPSLLAVPPYAAFYVVAKARHRLPAFRAEGTPDAPAQHVVPSPAFRNGLYASTVLTAGVAFAGLAWALFGVLLRRVSREAAALGTAATLLGTPLFPYATSLFDHTIAAALLFGAFALLDPLAEHDRRPWWPTAAGALLGLSVGTEYIAAVPAAILAAFAVVAMQGRPRTAVLSRLLLGAAGPLALLASYHLACFGSPFRTGYSFVTHPAFAHGQSSGFFGITWPRLSPLAGLLLGRSRGLFYVSPLALIGVVQGAREWRRARDPALLLGALVLSSLLLISASYYLWDGGRALGPRHLVPGLGFVGIGIGYAFERWRVVAASLAGASIAVMVLGTAVGIEAPRDTDVIFSYVIPAIREGSIARAPGASSWGLLLGLSHQQSLAPIALIVLGGFVAAARLSGERAS